MERHDDMTLREWITARADALEKHAVDLRSVLRGALHSFAPRDASGDAGRYGWATPRLLEDADGELVITWTLHDRVLLGVTRVTAAQIDEAVVAWNEDQLGRADAHGVQDREMGEPWGACVELARMYAPLLARDEALRDVARRARDVGRAAVEARRRANDEDDDA